MYKPDTISSEMLYIIFLSVIEVKTITRLPVQNHKSHASPCRNRQQKGAPNRSPFEDSKLKQFSSDPGTVIVEQPFPGLYPPLEDQNTDPLGDTVEFK